MVDNIKEKSSDRILILGAIEGLTAKPGLVNAESNNKLHAIMDERTCLWYLKYERGGIPPALKQKWTSFSKLKQALEGYIKTKNLEVKEVLD